MDNSFNRKGKKIIPMSLFITVRRNGTVKARLVAGGHRQDSDAYDKSKTSSPTASLHAIMSILNITASESRNLATVDIKQAFLEADMDEELYMSIDKSTS